jgi:hypothetical protein
MSRAEDESQQERFVKGLVEIAQQLSNEDIDLGSQIKIANLVMEISMKQYFNNRRLEYLKEELDTMVQRLACGKITEDIAKEDLDRIKRELNSIYNWSWIGVASGLLGLLGGASAVAGTATFVIIGGWVVVIVAGMCLVIALVNVGSCTELMREVAEVNS